MTKRGRKDLNFTWNNTPHMQKEQSGSGSPKRYLWLSAANTSLVGSRNLINWISQYPSAWMGWPFMNSHNRRDKGSREGQGTFGKKDTLETLSAGSSYCWKMFSTRRHFFKKSPIFRTAVYWLVSWPRWWWAFWSIITQKRACRWCPGGLSMALHVG